MVNVTRANGCCSLKLGLASNWPLIPCPYRKETTKLKFYIIIPPEVLCSVVNANFVTKFKTGRHPAGSSSMLPQLATNPSSSPPVLHNVVLTVHNQLSEGPLVRGSIPLTLTLTLGTSDKWTLG